MLGGSESTGRPGAKMKNQLESRGVREQRTQLRSCLKTLSGYDANPGKASTGHLVPPSCTRLLQQPLFYFLQI